MQGAQLNIASPTVQAVAADSVASIRMDVSDTEYLASIADLVAEIRPIHETAAEATGCPDPVRFADEDDWGI